MIVKSPYVNKEFNLPDEKLPAAQRFALKCPFTGKRIVFEKQDDGSYLVSAGESMSQQPAETPAKEPEPQRPALKLPQVEPDIYAPGTKVAFLFLDGGWLAAAETFFKTKGFAVSTAGDELTAIAKLRLNNYDVVLASDGAKCGHLCEEVASWHGGKRRGVNFILVGDRGRSNDPQAAFVSGANAYLALADEAQAGDLLEGALTGYDMHYQLLEMAKKHVEG